MRLSFIALWIFVYFVYSFVSLARSCTWFLFVSEMFHNKVCNYLYTWVAYKIMYMFHNKVYNYLYTWVAYKIMYMFHNKVYNYLYTWVAYKIMYIFHNKVYNYLYTWVVYKIMYKLCIYNRVSRNIYINFSGY